MIKAGILLLAGGLAAQHSSLPPGYELYKLILFAAIVACVHRRTRSVALILLGYGLLLQAGQTIIDARLDPRYAGDSMLAQVRVVDFPRRSGASVSFTVAPLDDARLPPRSRISWFEPPVVPALGEVWELELRLRRPRGTSNPGVFDRESWLFREGIHATGYVVDGKRNRLLWAGTPGAIDRLRREFVASATAAANTAEAAAVLAAVGVGARHLVSPEQWERYAITGTNHLMAISGLHVGLAATTGFVLAFAFAGLLPGIRNHYVVALAAGVVTATAYALSSGLAVPAQRSALMIGVAALALTRRRQPDAATTVAFAATTVYLLDPVAILSPGYSLSFGAVVLLLWLARRWAAARRRLAGLVTLQVFLTVGLLPFTAAWFQRFAALAVPVNIVAVPLFSLVTVPLTLAGLAAVAVSPDLARFPLHWAANSIDWLERGVREASGLPFADVTLASISGKALPLLLVPLLWVLLPPGWPGRHVGLLGVLALLLWRPADPPDACFDAWVLDVGQGLAVVLQTRHSVWMYDTGMAYRTGTTAADIAVLPFLEGRRIRRIDRLVVSHADLDHSGGIAALRSAVSVGEIVTGEPIPGVSGTPCHAGRAWREDGIEFKALHPQGVGVSAGNDASCVLEVSAGPFSLLLTGDAEAEAERAVLAGGRDRASVVVVPHHGSQTSSSAAFVDAVQPRIAIVSAGHGNRWGLPKQGVVKRWRNGGAKLFNTASAGAVSLRLCADTGITRLRSHREHRRRFWHDEA